MTYRPSGRLAALALWFLLVACASARTPPPAAATRAGAGGQTLAAASPAVPDRSPQEESQIIPIGDAPAEGPANALVTIVEFSDFQCPFCSRVEPTLAQLRQRYGDDLRIVWRNNPLPFHAHAMLAAEAAMAAHAQGQFWPMHVLLFQNQRALERQDLERYAEQLGLDMVRFRSDLDQHTHEAAIRADMDLAVRLAANGTPNFFINGTNVVGAQPFERFSRVIDAVLARARTLTPRGQVYAQMVADPVQVPDDAPPPAPSGPQPTLDPAAVLAVPVGQQPSRGPADALVTIVEFSDFQCPFCSRVEPTLEQLMQQYGRDVRVVWRNQPLPFHVHAMPAAEAAMEAFAQQGDAGFWRYHATLFQNQQALERADIERYAQQQQLDMPRFRAALDQHAHEAAIRADMQLAVALAATGTPHFFINGRRLAGAQPLPRFTAAVDQARAEAQARVRAGTPRAQVYAALQANAASSAVYLPGTTPEERVFTVRGNPRAPTRGGAQARVVLEHFADFQCPFCARVLPALRQIEQTYGNRVQIRWRDYPLPAEMHPAAMPAAEAAREALAQQGNAGFWRYHATLFQNQQALERADLERYAQQQQLNMPRFRAALDRHIHQAAIRADMAAMDATGEGGTPMTFINGHLVTGAQAFDVFQRVIDAQLNPNAAPPAAPPAAPSAGQPSTMRASHVLVMYASSRRAPSTVTRTRDEARVLAADVLRQARAGGDFATLARSYSDEPGAGERGGDLGRFSRGTMVTEFETAAFALAVGQISEVVESPFGFHVIRRSE